MTKAALRHALRGSCALLAIPALTACGTPPAADFSGDWRAVNRYTEATVEIPLSPAYLFFSTPIDGTLKTMLERWAADAGLQLSYRLGSDFTLHHPVTRIRTADIHEAAFELSVIYAPQGVSVTADGNQILVRPLATAQPAPTN